MCVQISGDTGARWGSAPKGERSTTRATAEYDGNAATHGVRTIVIYDASGFRQSPFLLQLPSLLRDCVVPFVPRENYMHLSNL
jgi:hypothetical protein